MKLEKDNEFKPIKIVIETERELTFFKEIGELKCTIPKIITDRNATSMEYAEAENYCENLKRLLQ